MAGQEDASPPGDDGYVRSAQFERELAELTRQIAEKADKAVDHKKKENWLNVFADFLGEDHRLRVVTLAFLGLLVILLLQTIALFFASIPDKNIELLKIILGGTIALLTSLGGFICGNAATRRPTSSQTPAARNQRSR